MSDENTNKNDSIEQLSDVDRYRKEWHFIVLVTTGILILTLAITTLITITGGI